MTIRRRLGGVTIFLAALGMVPAAAGAAAGSSASTTAAQPDTWRFAIPIGFYYFGIDGDVGAADVTRDIDLDAGDVNDVIDKAGGLGLEFGKGRWTGITSLSYIKFVGDERESSDPNGLAIEVEPSLEWTTAQAAVGYRIGVAPGPRGYVLEPVMGLRYTMLEGTLDITQPSRDSVDKDVSWADLFVGFRLHKSFTQHLVLSVSGDFGDGISNNAHTSWNAAASLGWRFPFEGWGLTVAGGYRLSNVDYENSHEEPFRMDITMSGPTIGVGVSW